MNRTLREELDLNLYTTMPAEDREGFLNDLVNNDKGREFILKLYRIVVGIPEGTMLPIGTLIRQTMIPAILQHDFTKKS
jgi:hypothetical protein